MNRRLIRLSSCPKGYTYDQDKACTPEETVARFQERLRATDLDVPREIRRIDNGRLDIPVYFSLCGDDARRVMESSYPKSTYLTQGFKGSAEPWWKLW